MAALFLVVVVGALGTFAVRMQSTRNQGPLFQLQEYRAAAAAHAGLEIWAYRIAQNNTIDCSSDRDEISLDNHPGLRGFRVFVWCEERVSAGGASFVYSVAAEGRGGTYGSPDFARHTLTRRIAPPSNEGATPTPGVYD